MDAEGADTTALAASDFWRRADYLELGSGPLAVAQLGHLCRLGATDRLRHLELSVSDVGPAAAVMATAPWAGSLSWLSVRGTDASVDGLAALSGGGFARLKTLHLSSEKLTDDGVAELVGHPGLPRLRLVSVFGRRVSDRSADLLLNNPHWRLAGLGLSHCGLSPEAVPALAGSPRLRRLHWLDLSYNRQLGGDALMPLAESPHLSRLCELGIGGIDASDRVRDALRERLGRRLSD